jgi:hypothetical protein
MMETYIHYILIIEKKVSKYNSSSIMKTLKARFSDKRVTDSLPELLFQEI